MNDDLFQILLMNFYCFAGIAGYVAFSMGEKK